MKTKFANKLVVAINLLVLAICILAPTVSATDYSAMEKLCKATLSDPNNNLGIIEPSVHISTDRVTITYDSTSTTPEAVKIQVGAMLATYDVIIEQYPEVGGDLLITLEDSNGNTINTFKCENRWMSNLDDKDASAVEKLTIKVIATAKKS